jgi:hypothetical protein
VDNLDARLTTYRLTGVCYVDCRDCGLEHMEYTRCPVAEEFDHILSDVRGWRDEWPLAAWKAGV